MRKAISTACAERPGAVHLTVPGDVAEQPARDDVYVAPPMSSAVRTVDVRGSVDPIRMMSNCP